MVALGNHITMYPEFINDPWFEISGLYHSSNRLDNLKFHDFKLIFGSKNVNNLIYINFLRHFWKFVNSEIWFGPVHITGGKLQSGLMEHLEELHSQNKIAVYSSVVYTRSNTRMRDFIIRNNQSRMKDNRAKTPEGEVTLLTLHKNEVFH